jgi:hypothetical protein
MVVLCHALGQRTVALGHIATKGQPPQQLKQSPDSFFTFGHKKTGL